MAGRGIDFEHRFKTSRWAEDLLLRSINKHPEFQAVRFGLSEVRPDKEVKYNKEGPKEPDLLVYATRSLTDGQKRRLEDLNLTDVERESLLEDKDRAFVTTKALAAIEVEFSPYRAAEMVGREWHPRTPTEWERRPLKHAKPPTAPNIWIKEEDLSRLNAWERSFKVPIIVAHLFDQEAFAIPLLCVNRFDGRFKRRGADTTQLQVTSGIFKKEQSYDRQDAQGAAEKKMVFVVSPGVSVKLGDVSGIKVEAQLGLSGSKKYVAHPVFSGGELKMSADFLSLLSELKRTIENENQPWPSAIRHLAESPAQMALWGDES